MQDYINLHYKYHFMELNTLKNYLNQRDQKFLDFKKLESKNLLQSESLKNVFGVFNYLCTHEVNRVLHDNSQIHTSNFWEYSRKEADHIITSHLI